MHESVIKLSSRGAPIAAAQVEERATRAFAEWVAYGISCVVYAIYDVMVRKPLRKFYFLSMYEGKRDEDICAQVTGHPAEFYASSPENMAECIGRLDRLFQSWDSAAMFLVHFSLLAFIVVRIILCLTCNTGGQHACHCGSCNHDAGAGKVITVEELKKLIEAIKQPQAT